MEHAEFDAAFAQLPEGYSEGAYEGRRFGVTVRRSGDGRRNSLFARELAGTDIVSFNLYRVTSDRTLLKPCEMSAEKVVAFVLDFRPAPDGQVEVPADRSACDARPPKTAHVAQRYQNYSHRPLDFVWQ